MYEFVGGYEKLQTAMVSGTEANIGQIIEVGSDL